MRIALLVRPGYTSDEITIRAIFGGLAAAYRALGHEVDAFFWQDKARPAAVREDRPWGRLWRLRHRRDLFLPRGGDSPARALAACDLAHLHIGGFTRHRFYGSPSVPLWLMFRWFLPGIPIGLTIQDLPAISDDPGPGGAFRRFVRKRMIRRSSWATAVSSAALEPLTHGDPDAAKIIAVVPNGYEPEEVDRARLSASTAEAPFVLCCARLAHYKGIDALLMAWHSAAKAFPHVHLSIAGPDPSDGHYQKLASALGLSKSVRFLGTLARDAVMEQIGRSLFVVLPSRTEAFGLSALEAMACGKAVVAARSGVCDYLQDGDSGLVVEPSDPDGLARAMTRLLRDPAFCQRLGRAAREKVVPGYCWDAVARRYLAAHARALNRAMV